jgi:hypothetical protein
MRRSPSTLDGVSLRLRTAPLPPACTTRPVAQRVLERAARKTVGKVEERRSRHAVPLAFRRYRSKTCRSRNLHAYPDLGEFLALTGEDGQEVGCALTHRRRNRAGAGCELKCAVARIGYVHAFRHRARQMPADESRQCDFPSMPRCPASELGIRIEHTGERSIRRQMGYRAGGVRRPANAGLSRTAAPTPTPASARLETARVMLR